MKIKANNIEDFKNQYYQQFDNKIPMEINIELDTNNIFWEQFTKTAYNNTIQSLKFMGVLAPEFKNVSQFFIPEYGNVKRC
jgi:hypothetical protein